MVRIRFAPGPDAGEAGVGCGAGSCPEPLPLGALAGAGRVGPLLANRGGDGHKPRLETVSLVVLLTGERRHLLSASRSPCYKAA